MRAVRTILLGGALQAALGARADRHFMETAVLLHRLGENVPYAGLRQAGTDDGPAIPTAERALASGDAAPLVALLSHALERHVGERLVQARTAPGHTEPHNAAEVQAARERVSAAIVEGAHQAARGGAPRLNAVRRGRVRPARRGSRRTACRTAGPRGDSR